ncbi:MAG: SAM-dependent methyltransferase [Roseovarius sp.]|nr:SAM-dependent methyltransferase [Roseovarius sp.]
MRLTWNEIRARAAAFAEDWRDAHYEKGETQSFYNAFFRIFGKDRKAVARYEMSVARTGRAKGFVDLFWPRTLIVEQKSKGRDLFRAEQQALDYLSDIADHEQPRFVLVSDFQTFRLTDLETRDSVAFALADLPKHVERFGFMLGITHRPFRDQDPVNIKAAELVGLLHDAIKASGYEGHKLEQFLVRIVFCLFADDTGIFQPKDILWDYLETRTRPDGSDMGPLLAQLFDVLNTPEDARSPHLDEDLAQFPYVNGALFAEYFPPPVFNADMRAALLNACRFDWTPISPAIFGSLFQSVMDPQERREKGAHYTTEQNILKVIEPLFLDDLRAEFARLKALRRDRRRRLEAFQRHLAGLTFFDPACGCGNFLIIAYRELRLLEIEVMRELKAMGELALLQSTIDVNQFYGIEYEEFPARIAETALWMMDHIMNNRLSLEFGEVFTRIPLRQSPTIVHGDALETDWAQVLPPERCSHVLGNPPFVGAKYQSTKQREQVRRIADLGKSGGTLDYVCAWFIKAGDYTGRAAGGDGGNGYPRIGFVSTNSITQGEQVAQLWPVLFDRCGLEIAFAHRTFPWGSEARGKANVHVVIIGLDRREAVRTERRLFSYPDPKGDPVETRHRAISPYLFDAGSLSDPHLVVREESRPINGLERIVIGSKPIDGGYFIFSEEERDLFLAQEPEAEPYMRPYIGAREFLHGGLRYILYLGDAAPADLARLPRVREVIRKVRAYRLGEIPAKGKAPGTIKTPGLSSRQLAETPTQFHVTVVPDRPFLVLPKVSSERRQYAPIGYIEPPTVASDLLFVCQDERQGLFALLTSAMHMAWLRQIGGRLESRYRYSIGLVYNTFPLPRGDLTKLEPHAQAVLDARANHPGATLADLYDPDLMPADLRRAHRALDRAVDAMYRRGGFDSDRERVEHLFRLYEAMIAPLLGRRGRRR